MLWAGLSMLIEVGSLSAKKALASRQARLYVENRAMTRATFLGSLGGLLVAKQRPNVLFIGVDDLRPELGIYGATHVHSPRMDSLGRSGTVFTKAYCQMAVCNPSRASLLTGLRPDTLRVWDLKTPFRSTSPNAVTIPQRFHQNGYTTTSIGKIFHNIFPDPQSWSQPEIHVDGFPFDPDAVYRSPEALASIAKVQTLPPLDQYGHRYIKSFATESPDVPDDAYYDGAQTTRAIETLRGLGSKGKPFFFGLGYYRPHLPFNAPKKYWDLYDRNRIPLASNPYIPKNAPVMAHNMNRELRSYTDFKGAPLPHQGQVSESEARLLKHGYLASISYVDAQVGRILDSLDRFNLASNTIVVLWGDHGWKLGEHSGWGKMTNYEIDARVPLIMRVPGHKANQQCHRMVEFVDVYPTLCDLAGISKPKELEGQSLTPLLANPTSAGKKAVFHQFLREGIWVAPDGVEYMGYAIRTETHRYIEWYRWKEKTLAARELYDLIKDPDENLNEIGQPSLQSLIEELSGKLGSAYPTR